MNKGKYYHRKNCRSCKSTDFSLVVDLGYSPLAGDFLKEKELGKEKFYPLKLYSCLNCGLVQLLDIVPKESLFQSYLSSIALKKHFQKYADEMVNRFLRPRDFVVEIGSNDGVLLEPLKKKGMEVLGIEPVEKIAKIARDKGLKTIIDYFGSKVARKIKRKADMVVANNVFAHIDNIDDVMRGVKAILKDDGLFVFEVHFLVDMIEQGQYVNIYHEHLSYYSVSSLALFLRKWGFEILEVKRISTHLGSIRVYAKKFSISNYKQKIEKTKKKFIRTLSKLRAEGKTVVGYGASGKANVLLNYCGITNKTIEYIIDESPLRYNRYTPGSHIPVYLPDKVNLLEADYVVILAWNYEKEIREKLKKYKKLRFIIPLPDVKII